MHILIQKILNNFTYLEYLSLVEKCPMLIRYYDFKKESQYYNSKNIYKINDHLPNDLIYRENIYFFVKLLNPIYFYFENFEIYNHINNNIILKSNNNQYIYFFKKLQNIILNSFKKNYYIFDTSIIINSNEIQLNVNVNELQHLNINYNNSKFLIKYTGVKLQNYTKMINNFELIKSF